MYDTNQIIEAVGDEIVNDPEKLLEFIVDHDLGESFVCWCNAISWDSSNK